MRHAGAGMVLWVALAACDRAESPAPVRPTDAGQADAGQDAAAQIDLPGGYTPNVPCGSLGRACVRDEECGAGEACRGVCLPDRAADSMACALDLCPPETPTCLAGTCVSRDELACVCTYTAARAFYPECGDLERAVGVRCTPAGGLCDGAPDACCQGLTCMQGEGYLGTCQAPCETLNDCTTGCCAQDDTVASTFCAGRPFCQRGCRTDGEPCDVAGPTCCDGLLCASAIDDGQGTCRPRCQVPGDCPSGCCRLFVDQDFGVCADAGQCADS